MGFEPTTPTLARLCSTSRPGLAASAFEGKTGREAALTPRPAQLV